MSSITQKKGGDDRSKAFASVANDTAKAVKRVCESYGYKVSEALGCATTKGEIIIKIICSDSGSPDARKDMGEAIRRTIKGHCRVQRFVGHHRIPYTLEMNGKLISQRRNIITSQSQSLATQP